MRIVEPRLVQIDEARARCASRCRGRDCRGGCRAGRLLAPALGLPMSGGDVPFAMPPRSKARKYSPGWKISQRGSGRSMRQRAVRDLLGGGRLRGLQRSAACRRGCSSRRGRRASGRRCRSRSRRRPRRRRRGHRAARHGRRPRLRVAAAARLARHAQVAGIDELHELGRLLEQRGVGARRIRGRLPDLGMARLHVRLLFRRARWRCRRGSRCSRASPRARRASARCLVAGEAAGGSSRRRRIAFACAVLRLQPLSADGGQRRHRSERSARSRDAAAPAEILRCAQDDGQCQN